MENVFKQFDTRVSMQLPHLKSHPGERESDMQLIGFEENGFD